MKGIILAGGSGQRLHPMTKAISKQLIPVWDKPLIYYPLSTLMLANVRDVLIITTPQDQENFKRLLGEGNELGLKISYAVQPKPEGLAQAFIIGRDFIGKDSVVLALGDNIFYGHRLSRLLQESAKRKEGATVFCYQVQDPERYGVIEFDSKGQAKALEEKPKNPRSSFAVTGIYFYDNNVLDIASKLKPSSRGELEITDVNRAYLEKGKLFVEKLGCGVAWLDTGTPASLLQASNFMQILEERQGLKVACLEEIAFKMGFIKAADVEKMAGAMKNISYGKYLMRVLESD